MSAYTHVRIDPPSEWAVFERGSEVLWTEILGSGAVKRYGRQGQEQFGLDIVGCRDGDPNRLVGVQLKAKGPRQHMKPAELREDFLKAIAHHPELAEYFFASTAPDDRAMDDEALALSTEQAALGRRIEIAVWGWETVQARIQQHPKAMEAFDVSRGAHAIETIERLDRIARDQAEMARQVTAIANDGPDLAAMTQQVASLHAFLLGGGFDRTAGDVSAVERYLDQEIDRYRDEELNQGFPVTARRHLEGLWDRLPEGCSGRLRFRVRALIGHCHLHMGDEAAAAAELLASADHAPTEPKARSNRVLGLVLLGRHPQAIAAARSCLEADPADAVTAGYLFQAASLAGVGDPLSEVPAALRDTDEVRRHVIVHDRSNDGVSWRPLARAGFVELPDDGFYRQMAAEADLSDAVEAIERGSGLDARLRALLVASADALEALWREAAETEESAVESSLSLCHNAAAAFVALDEPGRADALVREGLAYDPENRALILKAAVLACEAADRDWSADVFARLHDEGRELMAKVQLASMLGRWEFLASPACSGALATIPEAERTCAAVIVEFARVRLERPSAEDAARLVSGLTERFAGDPRALVLVSRLAMHLGLGDAAETAFEDAMFALALEAPPSQFLMVSALAEDRGDTVAVIEALAFRPAVLGNAEAVLQLARAYAYVQPPRADAASFFVDLPERLRGDARIVRLEAIARFNEGMLAEAEERARLLVEIEPNRVGPVLLLCQTLLRLGRRPEVNKLVSRLVPAEMTGGPIERMRFAQLLAMAGRAAEALAYGHATLDDNRDNPEVNVFWIGLAFSAEFDLLSAGSDVASVGSWVRLESEAGETHSFVISDGPDRPAEGIASTDNPFAANVLGMRVGHRFEMEGGFGIPVAWQVEEIQGRYLHAFREVSDTFNRRFPGRKDFWKLSMRDGDIGPIMEGIRRDGERRERLLEMHGDGITPIRSMAASAGGSVAFANTLALSGRDVRSCLGHGNERAAAMESIRRFRERGAAVDTLALWTILEMDALDDVLTVFPRIVVPQSTMDELSLMRDELVMEAERPARRTGTVSCIGGRFVYDKRTEEGRLATLDWLDRAIGRVGSSCEVAPARVDAGIGRQAHHCLAILGDDALDAGLVARELDLIHLTQDLSAREMARILLGVDGAWLQAVFMEAATKELIAPERYARLVVGLAARRHGHVAIDPVTLEAAVRLEDAEVEYPVAVLARYLGNLDADMRSHLTVVVNALDLLWTSGPVDLVLRRATGTMLEALVARRPDDWRRVLEVVESAAGDVPGLGEYVAGWKRGHFLEG